MEKRISVALLVILLSIVPFITGCLDLDDIFDDEEEEFDDGTVLPSTTKQLDGPDLDGLIAVSDDKRELVFDDEKGPLPSITEDDILSIGISERTPYGLLRKVSSIKRDGSRMTVRTTQATLEEAVKKGSIRLNESIGQEQMELISSLPGVTLKNGPTRAGGDGIIFTDVVLHSGEGGKRTVIGGRIDLDLDIIFDLDIDWFQIEECRFGTVTTFTGELRFDSNEELNLDEKFEVASFSFPPILIPIGGIVVIFVPTLSLVIGVRGTVEAGLMMEAVQNTVLEGYVEHPDWEPIREYTANFEFSTPVIGTHCLVRGFVGPELSLLIYGILGPYLSVHAYVEGEAFMQAEERSWWLYGGMEFGMGFKVEVLGIKIKDWSDPDIVDLRRLISSSANNLAEGWEVEKVDNIYSLVRPVMVLGSVSGPRILYLSVTDDGEDFMLKYAYREDGTWAYIDIARFIENDLYDLVQTQDGTVHLAFWKKDVSGTTSFTYCTIKDDEVFKQDISDPDLLGRSVSDLVLLLDSDGRPNLFYELYSGEALDLFYKFEEGMIKRAVSEDGSWRTERIVFEENVSITGMDAVIDKDSNVHLTYFKFNLGGVYQQLIHSMSGPGGWTENTLFEEELFWNGPSDSIIELGTDDAPTVLFDDNNGTMHLTRWKGGRWVMEEIVDIEHPSPWSPSLLVLGSGTPCVSYINSSGKMDNDHALKYALLKEGGWTRVTVLEWTNTWQLTGGTSLVEGPDGTVMMAFNDGRYLRLASRKA
ncbi:MAG: hypothetical protein MUC62_08800 [Candidatus Thermoplasmatota archaeon]|nr:hypothetical protein [Candidatus Thermoplasmatota archaeon]